MVVKRCTCFAYDRVNDSGTSSVKPVELASPIKTRVRIGVKFIKTRAFCQDRSIFEVVVIKIIIYIISIVNRTRYRQIDLEINYRRLLSPVNFHQFDYYWAD